MERLGIAGPLPTCTAWAAGRAPVTRSESDMTTRANGERLKVCGRRARAGIVPNIPTRLRRPAMKHNPGRP